jgi:hypothetical protein
MALWMSYSCFMAYLFLPFIISKVILSVRLDRESVSKSKSKSKKNIYIPAINESPFGIWQLSKKDFFFSSNVHDSNDVRADKGTFKKAKSKNKMFTFSA